MATGIDSLNLSAYIIGKANKPRPQFGGRIYLTTTGAVKDPAAKGK